MREHTREKGRYFRTEAGELLLDWGSNGANYTELDFSYVAKTRGGMRKIYGQVRRNADGVSYDTFDIMLGRKREKTRGSGSVGAALRAHIKAVTGADEYRLEVLERLPGVPLSAKGEIVSRLTEALDGWGDGIWDEAMSDRLRESGKLTQEMKSHEARRFSDEVWSRDELWCETRSSPSGVVAIGILNLDVSAYSWAYNRWRERVQALVAFLEAQLGE